LPFQKRVFFSGEKGVRKMTFCPDCGGELDEEGVCTECGFDTKEGSEEEEGGWEE